jgi:transposase
VKGLALSSTWPTFAIGEDASKRLDKVPAKVRVIVTRRPKYACRTCEKTGADDVAGIIQAPAPARLIEGGLPTEALVADVVVSKHADHLPLYRQSQILARHGVRIERSTLAQWVGAAAAELQPLHDHLVDRLKASTRLFCDETRCPVLDPGAGKTKTGFMWAIARDDRPWGGADPPAVAYSYAPGRGGVHAAKLLAGFSGILQVDGYVAYKKLAAPTRPGGPVTLAYCWSHLRRQFYEVYVGGNAPIATATLARIKLLYDIEAEIRGMPPEVRRAIRQQRSKPVIEALKPWFEASLAKVPKRQALRSARLRPQSLERPVPLSRRWPHRDQFQHGRAFNPRPGPDAQECTVRRTRSWRCRLGHDRVAPGDLQTQLRRSAGLDDRRPYQARQPMARLAHRRTDALGLRKTSMSRDQRGVAHPLTAIQLG